ncbi:hypothetical protein PHMEG_00021459 [Phytophthora megakarya]|uniref:Uncharacterized protein n=1 Tax=Phytophthora megakarya TaxID=4795 RepID=A0A225VMH0_9STRA|nr:hypothetical protein PHMEG_00021459 [Phytophthora megakarya]
MPTSTPSVSEAQYELIRDAIFDNDRVRVVELLALPGVDVDHFDAGGQTLLHLACFWGRMELVKLLVAAGASLKTKNAAGCTALDLATHWGHSAVAEVIRLRGGSSVWEDKFDKFGELQVELEALTLGAQHLETQNNEKRHHLEVLALELQSIQTQLAEEKSSHALTIESYQRARHQLSLQVEKSQKLEQDKASLTEQLNVVKKQEEVTHNWQRAEAAAVVSDSQRNFAFVERDQFHRMQLATLSELLVTTERFGAAEDELMKLKTDLAEHIFEMRREQRHQKRAAKATAPSRGNDGPRRPTTTPAEMATSLKKSRKPDEIQQLLQVARETPKRKFSLAAREFGDRVYLEEKRKLRERCQRHQLVENQYRAHGFRAPVVDADVFQEEFVATVRAFASSRSEKWHNLKHERDRQARFATTTLARPIFTAPLLFNPQSKLEGTLNYSLYRKYTLPLSQTSEATTTMTASSCTELRMHADFLSETKKKTENYPQLREEPTDGGDTPISFLPMI